MGLAKAAGLFFVTALAEISGCYLVYLWLKKDGSVWLVVPAALALAFFAWLLTLHPFSAGRTYAAYGAVYIGAAIAWLWLVERVEPTRWDLAGAAVAIAGMVIVVLQPGSLER